MDFDKLKKANALKYEIEELTSFINYSGIAWSGNKLTIKGRIIRFISHTYGRFSRKEFKMNNTIKNKVLDVLIEYRNELEEEFKNI